MSFSKVFHQTLATTKWYSTKLDMFGFEYSSGAPNENILTKYFSNSLIIHKQKTKEITTVTVVWILDLN